jgi:UDP-N-acetylglucosamine:LPS N-acetylglucosamine transferase
VRTTIIAGNNRKLFEKLQGRFRNIEVVGFTEKVYEYMQRADLVLSKPGGITLFEEHLFPKCRCLL